MEKKMTATPDATDDRFRCSVCHGPYPAHLSACPACGNCTFYNSAQPPADAPQTTDARSRDGITIGLIDAMLSLAHALNERLAAEARRMKRSKIEWEWFSDEVQVALADLAHNAEMMKLIRPHDENSMELIRRAAALIDVKSVR